MTTTTTTTAPVCAHCGNTGAVGSDGGLYLAVDARWNAEARGWLLQEREDTGGGAWDCLACDGLTPVHGPAALFPYGATLPVDRGMIDAAPDMLAALRMLLQDCNDSRLSGPGWYRLRASIAYARAAIAKAEGRA